MDRGTPSDIIPARPAPVASPSLSARIVATLRAEVMPGEADAPLTLAKLRLAQANMRSGIRSMPVLAVLCGCIHLQWATPLTVGLWLAGFFICLGARIWSERLMPVPGASAARVRRGAATYSAFSVLFMLSWASQGFIFWEPNDANNHLVIGIVMLSSAMSATLTSSWLVNPLLQIMIYVGGAASLFFLDGTQQGMILGVLACLYANVVIAAVLHIHANTSRLLTLEMEKDTLISSLRTADRAKSEFLANMSHELRTPLNAILGFSEVMKDEVMGPMANRAYKSYAGDIHSSGQHLLGLVNDILDLAKIEAGKLDLKDDVFTMDAIVDEGFRLFDIQADRKNVRLVKEVDAAIVLRWDLRAAKQIAINLLSNALKFTPAGGTITVLAGMRENGGCYVTVRDSGSGIAEEDRKVVFESFGQGRHDVATDVKSTGLGLAIVKALVELHGGEVWLASTPGEGAAFTIEVPAGRVSRTATASAAA